ncbi:MAG: hypothetical protein FWG47_05490 [Propionibacteriaceae bacterium]|nr:hypothetical protein [Propionibacteriaceae bacterium]
MTDPRASVALVRPPWTIGEEKAAWVSQRKAAARELCQRAGLHPDQQICMCTDDLLAEDVAAAVLAGKTQPDDLVLAVGLRSGCTVLCLSALFRILKAAGIETKSPPANGWNWYPGTPSQDSFPDEFDAKYGALGYRFSEDKKMMNQVLSSASTDQTEISDERL